MLRPVLIAVAMLLGAKATPQMGDALPVAYTVVDGAAIPEPLAAGGDAALGRVLAADPEIGGCAACHAWPGHSHVETPQHEAGHDLAGVGARRSEGFLRLAVVNYAIIDPDFADHAWYAVRDFEDAPEEAAIGATRLTALQIEHLVAWLSGLRD